VSFVKALEIKEIGFSGFLDVLSDLVKYSFRLKEEQLGWKFLLFSLMGLKLARLKFWVLCGLGWWMLFCLGHYGARRRVERLERRGREIDESIGFLYRMNNFRKVRTIRLTESKN